MLASFIYVGREALEMMFLFLMVSATIPVTKKLVSVGALGLICGLIGGFLIGDILEDYEAIMYAMLSALMLYLFATSSNLPAHVKGHVQAIANRTAGYLAGLFTIWFIFFRESMEIFLFMFAPVGDSHTELTHFSPHWTGAALAVIVVATLYKVLSKYKHTRELFTITRYAFLVFAVWFGYEAYEHHNIHHLMGMK
jgi:high-affinity Fe2+/Pb2+ permease